MLRTLAVAITFLTRVPITLREVRDADFGHAVAWFPLVGLMLGAVLAGAAHAGRGHVSIELLALGVVTLLAVLTGGLHLDGVADVFDGLAGGRGDRERTLAIMRDSRIGAFGAIALVLVLLLQVAAVSGIDARARTGALFAAPVVARALAPLVARVFPAPAAGHGTGFRASVGSLAAPLALAVSVLVAGVTLGKAGLIALAVAVGIGLGVGALMTRRLGGVSGDVYGAVIELGELGVLLTIAAIHPAR
jgi:adenosylcobinamide-GDP ribazoletransferase